MKTILSRTLAAGLLATCLAAPLPALAQAAAPATAPAAGVDQLSRTSMDSVLAGDWRSPNNRARDVYRHPDATLRFFGLKPDQTVIEITPGGGWYSEILAPLLHDRGHYIAAVKKAGNGREASEDFDALQRKFASDLMRYGNAKIIAFDPKAPVFGAPGSADEVLTFRNVHNWIMADTAPAMFKAFYTVLRPGGVLGVVDHRASAGATLDAVKKSGYLPTGEVVKLATDAGFVLEGSSEINANPKDTKNYPQGVWTLPPTYALGDVDKAKYRAIGESDRMTLRFVKPASPTAAGPAH